MEGRPSAIIIEPSVQNQSDVLNYDSITLIATKRFEANFVKRIFQGNNYRKAWSTPITVPVGNLAEMKGGLKPLELGGGAQTASMDLAGENGVIYTLRSVNKDPSVLIPKLAKKLNIENIVMDAMSAQHPYGAVLSAALAEEAGILSTQPQVYFVPHQLGLDTFNRAMGGRLYLLEYEPEGSGEWLNIENVKEIIDTKDVKEILEKNTSTSIDEHALVRCRLFDMLVGDWDRHHKQWGWVVVEKNDKTTFIPLPTDRDNVFYNPKGVLPWLITRPFSQPQLRPYRKKIRHMKGLVKPFDVEFLHDIPASVFVEEAKYLQNELDDEAIDRAMQSWSPEFVKNDGATIKKRIQARRKDLVKYARKFKEVVDEKWKKEAENQKKGKMTLAKKGT